MSVDNNTFYNKAFPLVSEEEQRKEKILPPDGVVSTNFEESMLSEMRERRMSVENVLYVPRNETVPKLDYPVDRPIEDWNEVVRFEDSRRLVDEMKLEKKFKMHIDNPRKELQLNLILYSIKNSEKKLRIDDDLYNKADDFSALISLLSEGVSDKDLYLINKLYQSGINFNISGIKSELKQVTNLPLFDQSLALITQYDDGDKYVSLNNVMSCYRTIRDYGLGISEKIKKGKAKVELLDKVSGLKEIVNTFSSGDQKIGLSWHEAESNPYIFDELEKFDITNAEATVLFVQWVNTLKGRYEQKIRLSEFVYLSNLLQKNGKPLNYGELDDDFAEKNNLVSGPVSSVALFLRYPQENLNSQKNAVEKNKPEGGRIDRYVDEKMPFLKSLADQFGIKKSFNSNMGSNLNTINEVACPLRFLSEHSDFIEFIRCNFRVKNFTDLEKAVKNILKNRCDLNYESKLNAVKNLQATVGNEKEKIANTSLLNENCTPDFINWLAVLYVKSGYDILKAEGYGYMNHKLKRLRYWHDDKETFDQAISAGILGTDKDDLSGEYTSNLYRYDRIVEIVKNPDILKFTMANTDVDLLKVTLNNNEDINLAVYWYQNQSLFEDAKSRGLFIKRGIDDYAASNLERIVEINNIFSDPSLLSFSDAYPALDILNIIFSTRGNNESLKSVRDWAYAWYSDANEFKIAEMIGLFDDPFDENILRYDELEALSQVEEVDVQQFKQIYDLETGKRLFWGGNLKRLIDIPNDKRMEYVTVVSQIDKSPSQEMQRIKEPLVLQVLETDDPLLKYKEIENIFIKNNLPLVGKIYNIFKTLHPSILLEKELESNILSPALKSYSTRKRYQVIFNDLLGIHVDSANRNLEEFLKTISSGQEVIERYEKDGQASLSPDETRYLRFILKRMHVVYDNSSKTIKEGDNHEKSEEKGNDIADGIRSLRSNLGITDKQSISQRLVDMFARPLGYSDIVQILRRMHEMKNKSDQRNRSLAHSSDGFQLREGDLLKGVNVNFIENILQNGSVAKEYLGQSADSDSTPFDTDVAMIMPGDDEGRVKNAKNMVGNYGDLCFVIRNRGQFLMTNEGQRNIDPSKMELFKTGVVGSAHYGIRTGFPATEIDFMIANNRLKDNKRALEKVFIEIAQNGYYIPIVDNEGQLLLSTEKYDEYKKTFAGIEQFNSDALEIRLPRSGSKLEELIFEVMREKNKSTERNLRAATKANEIISEILNDCDISLKDKFETSIIGAEIYDTGSTARHTDNPDGMIDFDLVVRIDEADASKAVAAEAKIKKRLKYVDSSKSHDDRNGLPQIRLAGVEGISDQIVDLDVCFVRKSDLVRFGSHDAIEEKLRWIKNNRGDEVFQKVVANIVLAKQILKKGGAYKKIEQGGIGGIGVENWILANGGNLFFAARDFLTAAKMGGATMGLSEFKQSYKILDPGNNLLRPGHENFTEHLTNNGYVAMIAVCEDIVKEYA